MKQTKTCNRCGEEKTFDEMARGKPQKQATRETMKPFCIACDNPEAAAIARKKSDVIRQATRNKNKSGKDRTCQYCGERKHHSLFPMHKDGGRRDVICLDCHPRIEQTQIEWAQIALQPVSGGRYRNSVAISIDEYVERKKPDTFEECDYGNGVGVRGRA